MGKHVCRRPSNHHWITGGITTEADPLEGQHRRKGTSGKHKQNQGSDFWAKVPCASEFWQISLQPGSQGHRHPFHFLWWLFQLDPQAMQCYPWLSEVWCQLQVQVKQCIGQTRQTDGRLMTEVTVGREKLEVVPWFYYLGDCLSPGGSGELTTITKCCVLWGKVNKLLPIFTSRSSPITCRGRVYNGVMLHASETWAQTLSNFHHLQWNNWAMSPWMRDVTTKDQISSQDLRGYSLMTCHSYSAPANSDETAL